MLTVLSSSVQCTAYTIHRIIINDLFDEPCREHFAICSTMAGSLLLPYRLYSQKSTARMRQQLDVFHLRNLRKILGITWKHHVTNMEVLSQTGQRRLQDIVADRRLRMAGHIIRMPPGRLANHAMSWTPRSSGRRRGHTTKT